MISLRHAFTETYLGCSLTLLVRRAHSDAKVSILAAAKAESPNPDTNSYKIWQLAETWHVVRDTRTEKERRTWNYR